VSNSKVNLLKGTLGPSNWRIWLAFVIWPFGTLVYSFAFIGKRAFSIVLVLFYLLYGYTYIVIGKDQDTYRISQYFEGASKLSFSDLWNKLTHLYELTNKPDIFQDLLQFVVSRFTQDPQIYFAITAVLLAVVSALIFEDVLKNREGSDDKINFFALLVALFLLLVLSPGRINSFRHYFATAIFLFAVHRYLTRGGIKYLFLLGVTPFIHFAFIAVIPVMLIYRIVGNRFYVYYVLVVLSFVYSSQVSNYVREYTTELDTSALQYHASRYTSEVYLRQVQELKAQRYYVLDNYIYFSTIFFLVITVFISNINKIVDEHLKNLFGFSLLIFSFVNLFNDLESIANRFGVLYHGFCCIFLIRLYLNSKKIAPLIMQVAFFSVMLLNAIIVLRILIQSASVSTLLLFFPVSIFAPIEVSILDWIR
jgi:hypothetical protein